MQQESPMVTIDRLSILCKTIESTLDDVRKMGIEEAAQVYVDFRQMFDYLDATRDEFARIKERLAKEIIPAIFEESSVDGTINLKSGYRVTLAHRMTATILDKEGAYKWLEDNGMGDIIQPTVNASTLAAVAKNLLEENRSLPPEYFKAGLTPNTSMTKIKTK
jgi:hypothetical protein